MQFHRNLHKPLYLLLVLTTAFAPTTSAIAQTNAAAQAVRQRVQGLGQQPTSDSPPEQPVQQSAEFSELGATTAPVEGGFDTTFISPGATAVVVFRPAQLMTSPIMQNLPIEVATAAGLQYLGFDPADVDEVIAFVDLSTPMMPAYGITFRFNKPFKASSIPPQYRAAAQLSELNGKKYLQSGHPLMPSFYGPNKQTLVCAPDETLRQLVAAQGQATTGPALDRARQAPAGSDLYIVLSVPAALPFIANPLAVARSQAPPDAQPLFEIANLISALELTLNISGSGATSLLVHANDEAAADQIQSLITDASQKYQALTKAQYTKQAASDDPVDQAWARYAERISGSWTDTVMPQRSGATLTIFQSDGLDETQKKMLITGLGIAAAMGLPAQQGAREAAMRNQSTNHMKQISLALLNYHDARNAYPAHAIYSDDGKPLLSWRVAILPYIEEMALYNQFHLDEPWDSEHNKALIAQMPDVFKNPNVELEPGKTNYLAIVGEGMFMEAADSKGNLRNITDGTSNTIAFVEADPAQAVEWTKPDDLEFNPDDPKAGLGNVRPGAWLAAYCDGSVRPIAEGIDNDTLKAMFTRAGGEVVDRYRAPAPPVPAN